MQLKLKNLINGKPQEPDDFQPRLNIRKQWDDGQLSTKEEIQSFCQEFTIEPVLVKSYILHLEDLRIQANLRKRGREEQKTTTNCEISPWLLLAAADGLWGT